VRFLPKIPVVILGAVTLGLGYRACSTNQSSEVVTRDHAAYLCKDPSTFQTLTAAYSQGSLGYEVEKLKTKGDVVILPPGTHIRFLEEMFLTPHGLVHSYPNAGREPKIFPIRKVIATEGAYEGVEGWILAADVGLKHGPPL
jgi:hypothetical protein